MSCRLVLKDEPVNGDGQVMEFRLIYEGELFAIQRDRVSNQRDAKAGHKHAIRRQLHPQLKQLWSVNRFLREHKLHVDPQLRHRFTGATGGSAQYAGGDSAPMVDVLAANYGMFGFNFVPLVREEMEVSCALDILFLRRDNARTVVYHGDLDNRLKTFFDALRLPQVATELVDDEDNRLSPTADEGPFFCLMEDDKLITRLSVDTDVLLTPAPKPSSNDVKIIMTVTIRPERVTTFNLSFA